MSTAARPRPPGPRLLPLLLPLRELMLFGLLFCALAMPQPASAEEERLSPRQAAEVRYADKLVRRAVQRTMQGQWRGARSDYREAIKSLTVAYGEVHPRIAELYVMLGRTRFTEAIRNRRRPPGDLGRAREDFAKAIEVYDALPDANPEKLLEAYVYYGDVLTTAGLTEEAREQYLRAFDLLVEKASAQTAANYFAKHLRLYAGELRGERHDEDQVVSLRFTIGADGLVHDVEDAGSSATPELIETVSEFLRESRFRPRIVDRVPQPVPAYAKLLFPADGSPPEELAE